MKTFIAIFVVCYIALGYWAGYQPIRKLSLEEIMIADQLIAKEREELKKLFPCEVVR
jgi:hypothetical protein